MSELKDCDSMPFGKHRGKQMQDVPVNYLHWLWNNGMRNEQSDVANYIRNNIAALKLEDKDLIWE